MKSVFTYDDYRAFLRDFYADKKAVSKAYSFRFFARKAGLGSPNYFKLVMDGDRSLTHRHIRKFVKGLGLSEREAHYFENLVLFNQAKETDEKRFFEKNLELARKSDDHVLLTRDQHDVLANWWPMAVRELILTSGFEASPKKIAARLDHRISPQQVRDSLDLLERLGLIRIHPGDGSLRVRNQALETPDLTKSDALVSFHKQMIDLAKESVDGQSASERCLSGLTVSVRKKDLPEAFKKIHEFRKMMDSFLSEGRPYDAVYQLNLQFFRLDTDVD